MTGGAEGGGTGGGGEGAEMTTLSVTVGGVVPVMVKLPPNHCCDMSAVEVLEICTPTLSAASAEVVRMATSTITLPALMETMTSRTPESVLVKCASSVNRKPAKSKVATSPATVKEVSTRET